MTVAGNTPDVFTSVNVVCHPPPAATCAIEPTKAWFEAG